MKRVVIIGAGTAGTMVANQLHRRLGRAWEVVVVDPEPDHVYQPGLLFVPFGKADPAKLRRPRLATLDYGIKWVKWAVEAIQPAHKVIDLVGAGSVHYDVLIIASGARLCPGETPGLLGPAWRNSIFDFYSLPGARALRGAFERFERGRIVANIVEMPIKCPVAPLELLFLADEYFTRRGIRQNVELVFATPMDAAFTRPIAAKLLDGLLKTKNIRVEAEFAAAEVDPERKVLRSWDEREVPYDLLVTVPLHRGAFFVEVSELGNELGYVPTERHSLQVKGHEDMFALGDATDLPTSKAGSVAHFQSAVVIENVLRSAAHRSLDESYDGHANCFVESGFGRGLLIDFNYDVEPHRGRYPLPGLGPFKLLEESRINHWGKLAFEWVYWHRLLRGKSLPVPHRMSMRGKWLPVAPEAGAGG